jgi:dUTPase
MRIQRVGDHQLPLPQRIARGAPGWRLQASEGTVIDPGEVAKIPTGFAWEIDPASAKGIPDIGIPTMEFGMIRDLSSGPQQGRVVEAGVVDGDCRREIHVYMRNHGTERVEIVAGDFIAQMIVMVAAVYPLEESDSLSEPESPPEDL